VLGDNNEQIGSLYIGDEYFKQSICQKQVESLKAAGQQPLHISSCTLVGTSIRLHSC